MTNKRIVKRLRLDGRVAEMFNDATNRIRVKDATNRIRSEVAVNVPNCEPGMFVDVQHYLEGDDLELITEWIPTREVHVPSTPDVDNRLILTQSLSTDVYTSLLSAEMMVDTQRQLAMAGRAHILERIPDNVVGCFRQMALVNENGLTVTVTWEQFSPPAVSQ